MKVRLVPILAIAGALILAPAAPAFAHSASLGVSAMCAPGGWQVAWTIQNGDGHAAVVSGVVSFGNGATDQVVQDATLAGNGAVSGAPFIPAPFERAALVMRLTWTDGRASSTILRDTARRPECAVPAPTATQELPPAPAPIPVTPEPSPSTQDTPSPAPSLSATAPAVGPSVTPGVVARARTSSTVNVVEPKLDGSVDLLGIGAVVVGVGLLVAGLAVVGVVVAWAIRQRRRSVAES